MVFFFFLFSSDVFSLTWRTESLPQLHSCAEPPGRCPPLWSPSQGELVWVQVALSSSLLQRWQQAFLYQVSLQRVKDVELLISTEGQELLDHLAGVGAPEKKQLKKRNQQTKENFLIPPTVFKTGHAKISFLTPVRLGCKLWLQMEISIAVYVLMGVVKLVSSYKCQCFGDSECFIEDSWSTIPVTIWFVYCQFGTKM